MFSNVPLYIILVVIFAHWLADFVAQTDKMAIGKSTSLLWLTEHILAYTSVIFVVGIITVILSDKSNLLPSILIVFCWSMLNGALHWIIDFFTSKINSVLWKNNQRHWFFVSLGFDQVLHYFCLFTTVSFILR